MADRTTITEHTTMKTRRLTILLAAWLAAGPALGQAAAPARNVVAAGAVGDGQADCTAVFQRLLDEAGKAGGGVVDVPAGRFRINGNLSVPANVTLQGIFRVPPSPERGKTGATDGSVLLRLRRARCRRRAAVHPPGRRQRGHRRR